MKKLFIVANWKSNLTSSQANEWVQALEASIKNQELENKEVILFPSFTLLSNIHSSLQLGAQNISPFDEGAYTGEVNGKQIKEFAKYVLIGHSERRKHFFEEEKIVERKVEMAKKYDLIPIVCVQDAKTPIPSDVTIVAYEPVFAIGTGTPDTPENAEQVAREIKEKSQVQYVLYGGSIDSMNVKTFTQRPTIDGVLVGSSSLDPQEFSAIINHA